MALRRTGGASAPTASLGQRRGTSTSSLSARRLGFLWYRLIPSVVLLACITLMIQSQAGLRSASWGGGGDGGMDAPPRRRSVNGRSGWDKEGEVLRSRNDGRAGGGRRKAATANGNKRDDAADADGAHDWDRDLLSSSQQKKNDNPQSSAAASDSKNKRRPVVAYAASVIKCSDHQTTTPGLRDAAIIFRHSVHVAHMTDTRHTPPRWSRSKYDYQMYLLVHPQASHCVEGMAELGYTVRIVDPPLKNINEVRNPDARRPIKRAWCCGEAEFIKLGMYNLIDHPVVVHVDLDAVLSQPIEELLDAIVYPADTPEGRLARSKIAREPYPMIRSEQDAPLPEVIDALFARDYPNIWPGKIAGFQAGFIVVRPSVQTYNSYVEILKEGNFTDGYTNDCGWGNAGYCGFVGAAAMQGIVPYYYDIVAPNTAVEINGCIYNHMNANVIYDAQPNFNPRKRESHNKCRNGYDKCESCYATPFEKIKSIHYTNCRKPWTCSYDSPEKGKGVDQKNTNLTKCIELHTFWNELRIDLEDGLADLSGETNVKSTRGGTYLSHMFKGHCTEAGSKGYIPMDVSGKALEVAPRYYESLEKRD